MNNLKSLFIREEVIKGIRAYFEKQKFHEVITPTLNEAIPTEPNIFPFTTDWNTPQKHQTLYLSTSPERGLKLMLAQGMGNCYAISKSFRTLENLGSLHSPEFLMLEWYRENADYTTIVKDVQTLVIFLKKRIDQYLQHPFSSILTYQNKTIELKTPWPIFSLTKLFQQHAGLDYLEILKEDNLFNTAKEKGYQVENATWSELFDQIFVNEIEPHLSSFPCFIIDFPARLSPLCSVNQNNPLLAERFEFFMAGYEIANGNNENTDTESIQKVFEKEAHHRKKSDVSPTDTEFLQALQKMSYKKYAGIGLGVDRLAMIFANVSDIKDIEPFYSSFM